ncbi:MAG: family 16 glycosylhydrolase [Bacteroidetes bacterium]|jgi:beta-glucanase (GH16 family)|nr:family 16 glycosylhydrolase [Bacteroidota bacterium]
MKIFTKNLNNTPFYFLLFFAMFFLIACGDSSTQDPTEDVLEEKETSTSTIIKLEAENFSSSSSEMTTEEGENNTNYVVTPAGDTWLAFDVDIEQAGRYKFEINGQADQEGGSVWMEDYTDNKDGRTYNVTGSVPLSVGSFSVRSKDGSPLNKGVHKMKLHAKGVAKLDWVTFTLMKKHQLTPQKLTQKTDGKEWKVVWADEFEGEGMPDTSKWTYDIGDWGWGNNELQYYTDSRLENARLEDGNLVIEARKNDMNQEWTSARLTTRGKVTFLYGRIEFRAKVPPNKGNWAAGWTLGDDYVDELSWPYCGEIDILESVGYEIDNETGNGKAHASAHCGAYYFKLGNQPTGIIDVENMNNEYHIYAVDWTPEGIIASVDGKEYFTYNDTSTDLAWPFGKAQNLILNLAMGGGWGGLQGMDETMTSQKFLVDYVRVYEKS